jgi:hypothetical protein
MGFSDVMGQFARGVLHTYRNFFAAWARPGAPISDQRANVLRDRLAQIGALEPADNFNSSESNEEEEEEEM